MALSSDFGRVTRIVASGYDRSRVHQSTIVRGEQRTFVLSLAGAIPSGRTIVSARWQLDYSTVVTMSNARISDDRRETSVDIRGAWIGCATLKCTATLDNGEDFAQLAVIRVFDSYWFTDGQTQIGPNELTVTA